MAVLGFATKHNPNAQQLTKECLARARRAGVLAGVSLGRVMLGFQRGWEADHSQCSGLHSGWQGKILARAIIATFCMVQDAR